MKGTGRPVLWIAILIAVGIALFLAWPHLTPQTQTPPPAAAASQEKKSGDVITVDAKQLPQITVAAVKRRAG